jgi:hypothetical protein
MLLILKLTFVPALVLSVSLATRRWGPRIGGVLTGLPIVSGPALLFFAVEQGDAFAAEASRAVLVSLLGVAASAVTYAWASLRTPWWVSLPASWTSFLLTVLLVQRVRVTASVALAVALVGIVIAHAMLPRTGAHATGGRPAWDLPLRVVSSMALVVSVTALADRLGPTLSGALTPFPVAISVLLAFSHAQQGSSAAIRFLRGFLPGMWSFAAFCYVLSVTLVAAGTWGGFLLALASVAPIQLIVFRWMQRSAPTRRRADPRRRPASGPPP